MRKAIKIEKPYITEGKSDIFGESVKLCANVTFENPNNNQTETKVCYFEFEKQYKKYLCIERSDAFVMGLLTAAMENDMDIEYETPISERLYYQLMTYYIPLVSKYNANYPMHDIMLIGSTDNKIIANKHEVATGCSGGVDSFYTIVKHTSKDITETNKLTHIVYSSCGTNDYTEEKVKLTYKKNMNNMLEIAKECNLNTICCFNNLFEFYKKPYRGFNMFYTTSFGSNAFAIQKLISIYYVSSGPSINTFNLDVKKLGGHDSSAFDIFTTQCMNSENLTFYSTGIEYTRIEKEQYISDFVPAQNNLIVCAEIQYMNNLNTNQKNCSRCKKCIRTMVHLYVLGKIENFKNVFDLNYFYKNKVKLLGKFFAYDKVSYVKSTRLIAKKNKIKIPFMSYVYEYLWYKPIKHIKNTLKNSLIVRKIYYKFNLDIKVNGYRHPVAEIYQEEIKNYDKKHDKKI